MLQTNEVAGWTKGLEGLALFLELVFGVSNRLDGETDTALDLVDLNHTGFHFVGHLEDVLDALHVLFAELGDVDESVDVAVEADEGSEGRALGNRSSDLVSHLELAVDVGPWIVVKLLDT